MRERKRHFLVKRARTRRHPFSLHFSSYSLPLFLFLDFLSFLLGSPSKSNHPVFTREKEQDERLEKEEKRGKEEKRLEKMKEWKKGLTNWGT